MKKNLKAAFTAVFVLLTLHCGYSKNAHTMEEKSKTFNGVEIVYESSTITEAEVDKLGEYFIASEYADGNEKMAVLTKKNDVYQFYLIVLRSVLEDQEYIDLLRDFKTELCAYVFPNRTVDFYLSDGDMRPLILFPAMVNTNEMPKFVIVNETGFTIHYIYVSESDNEDWEEDVLGENILENEEVFTLRLAKPLSAANRYDIRLVDSDGDSYSKYNVLINDNMFVFFVLEDIDGE